MATPGNCAAGSFTANEKHQINFGVAMMPCLRVTRAAARVFLPLLFLLIGAVGSAVAQSGTTVRINEVESNGGTPDDWFELHNTGASTVDVSGWKMKDNDDTHSFTLPAGSTIAPGAFLVFDTQTASTPNGFNFGLGSADSVRIYDPSNNLLETYSWTAHAATTYGRCPNGTGEFVTTVSSTKGAANDCPVRLNEVESNGGTPDDWFELYNEGTATFDVSGWKMKDNDDTHSFTFPAGSTIAAGSYLVFDTLTASTPNGFNFGLGSADSVRIYDSTGALYETYSWTAHATTTYGRCPNGTGAFTTTASSTKNAANTCGGGPASPVKINEVESTGGVPGDWIELHNPSASAANIGLFTLKDNDDSHSFTIPAGASLAAGAYLAFDVDVASGFGLGDIDSARLFDTTGTLVDTYSWTSHAPTTYGRCPNGTGGFAITVAPTKGAANACRVYTTWPGGADVQISDGLNVFGTNLGGLKYEDTAVGPVLWAIRNGPSTLFRLVKVGGIWTPDPAAGWGSGKTIVYPNGTGGPDSEGVTITAGGSSGGVYVATERDNNNNSVSRIGVLRFDPATAGTTLTATHEWNLTADLPVSGANLGAEGITWIPDTFLTASNFFDESKNHIYDPSEYPNHGSGLFFVGLESNGNIYGFALDHGQGGAFTRIATISSGFPGVMDLQFDPMLSDFWAICDDTCQGRSVVLRVDGTGRFVVAGAFERPGTMPNINNEGFSISTASACVDGRRPAFWSDDSNTDNHAIRTGTLSCSPVVTFTDAIPPKAFPTMAPGPNGAGWNIGDVSVTWHWADNPGGVGIDGANCTTSTTSSGEGTVVLNASCKDLTGNIGSASYTVKVDKTNPTVTASAKKADNTPYTFGTWSNQTVTVHYTCSDSGSQIASCSADTVFSADGDSSTSGNGTDNAGRTGNSGSVSIKIDKTAPNLSITSPANLSYENTAQLPIDWAASDAGSGVASQSATLDGGPITKGQVVDLFFQALGAHIVVVNATDNAGNTASASASFSIGATAASIMASVNRLVDMGGITNEGIANSLKVKLGDNPNQLNAFLNELDAQRGKKVIGGAYELLRAAALYLIAHH